jgi:hypothetical protein
MKRSVAIVGPTPSFVRWAIRHACPLRQIDVENLPDATFRQLRILRELSLARIEKRVFKGICFHSTMIDDPDTARGFFEDEVADFFGGIPQISNCCNACCANAAELSREDPADKPKVWAGCFGWLPSKFEAFDYVAEFHSKSANWFAIWRCQQWNSSNLYGLLNILDQVRRTISNDTNLRELAAAARTCMTNQLILETELVPSGRSDGLHWTINSHCPDCKFEMSESDRHCPECGKSGAPNRTAKRNVLGLRPYMFLKHLIGQENAEQRLREYRGFRR